MQFYDVALAAEQINKVKNLGSDKDEYNELYWEQLCVAFTYTYMFSVYSKWSVRFPKKPFTLTNDLLMNSSENSMDNCMHSQTSAMVKFICNIYSVSLDISKKYFKMY